MKNVDYTKVIYISLKTLHIWESDNFTRQGIPVIDYSM